MKTKSLKIKIILAFFLFIFFKFYLDTLGFGLPYFISADETAGIKSLLYFYGFFFICKSKYCRTYILSFNKLFKHWVLTY